ncbi:MAG: hypothetical protein ACK55Z_03220, partial [bacterium]
MPRITLAEQVIVNTKIYIGTWAMRLYSIEDRKGEIPIGELHTFRDTESEAIALKGHYSAGLAHQGGPPRLLFPTGHRQGTTQVLLLYYL